MPLKIVVLSGPVCAGKSTLAARLASDFGVLHVRTQGMLEILRPDVEKTRKALQELGTRLDKKTKGAWVRDALEHPQSPCSV